MLFKMRPQLAKIAFQRVPNIGLCTLCFIWQVHQKAKYRGTGRGTRVQVQLKCGTGSVSDVIAGAITMYYEVFNIIARESKLGRRLAP